jgi:hypothetical protein
VRDAWRVTFHILRFTPAVLKSPYLPLTLAWAGYFTPWLWPTPAALRLSGYDLVEWLTFAQSVRDGTYPITRLDMLWPLVGIALLTAMTTQKIEPQRREEHKDFLYFLRDLCVFAVKNWLPILFALFAAFLILPGYPSILTAMDDAELRPQLLAGIITGVGVIGVTALAWLRPNWARWASVVIALLSVIATLRAAIISRQPITDILTKPAPVGYGVVLAVVGFGWLVVVCFIGLWRGKMPGNEARV